MEVGFSLDRKVSVPRNGRVNIVVEVGDIMHMVRA